MSYSQSDEEQIILEHFKDKNDGILLEIGAYHPTTFSNSRALIEKGWSAFLVEASPRCFCNLMNFYKGNEKVCLINAFISQRFGLIEFHDSEGAVATGCKMNYDRWKEVQKDFHTIYIPQIPGLELNNMVGKCDFLSIDCEGMDYTIAKSIMISALRPSLVCIEVSTAPDQIQDHFKSMGYSIKHENGENIIFAKEWK